MVSYKRHFAKTVSWRIIGTLDTSKPIPLNTTVGKLSPFTTVTPVSAFVILKVTSACKREPSVAVTVTSFSILSSAGINNGLSGCINTLNTTDIATQWFSARAVLGKAQGRVFSGIKEIRENLPFT